MNDDEIVDRKKEFNNKLNAIMHQVDRAAVIIDQMRGFARANNDIIGEVDLCKSINQCFIFFREQFKTHNIDFQNKCDDNLPLIYLNDQKFEQIVVNLLSNARFVVDKKESLSIPNYNKNITICMNKISDNKLCLEISDNGIGMDEIQKEKCLEPFFTTKDVGEGTGLGLSIVYSLVKEINASLEIESSPNIGTKMRVIIPIK